MHGPGLQVVANPTAAAAGLTNWKCPVVYIFNKLL